MEIYYLSAEWVFVATVYVSVYTDPAGRMANAVRDNPERAGFIGYSARRVRFISFVPQGFAGVAGGLFALNYGFITGKPERGDLRPGSADGLYWWSWLLYRTHHRCCCADVDELTAQQLHRAVDAVPRHDVRADCAVSAEGFAGFIMMHQTAWLRGNLSSLFLPYLITGMPAIIFGGSILAAIEMLHHGE